MEGDTFRSRLSRLAQKSRKALRLYTSMGQVRAQDRKGSEYAEKQINEWREVNAALLQELTTMLSQPHSRRLAAEVYALTDRLYGQWRFAEAEQNEKHKELIISAERGDFIKVAQLANDLVCLKARVQATQAAHHELLEVLQRSKVNRPAEMQQELFDQRGDLQPCDEQLPVEALREELTESECKVIPLRRRRSGSND